MELKPNELTALKLDCITKGIDSIKRAEKHTTMPIIAEVYATQIAALENWRSQIKTGK